MLYKEEQLTPFYNEYLENKNHKGRAYTKVWFWNLLLRVKDRKEIWTRDRAGSLWSEKTKVRERDFNLYKIRKEEWYSARECEQVSWISEYLYKKTLNDTSRLI